MNVFNSKIYFSSILLKKPNYFQNLQRALLQRRATAVGGRGVKPAQMANPRRMAMALKRQQLRRSVGVRTNVRGGRGRLGGNRSRVSFGNNAGRLAAGVGCFCIFLFIKFIL